MQAFSILCILLSITFISLSYCGSKNSIAFFTPINKFTIINIPINSNPYSVSILFIVPSNSFIFLSIWLLINSNTLSQTIHIITFIHISVFIYLSSFSIHYSVFPVSFLNLSLFVDFSTFSMFLTILIPLSFVEAQFFNRAKYSYF